MERLNLKDLEEMLDSQETQAQFDAKLVEEQAQTIAYLHSRLADK